MSFSFFGSVNFCARRSTRAACLLWGLACVAALSSLPSFAQDANNGRLLYNTPLVVGEKSCAASTCHTPDPLLRINKIQNGDTAGGIAVAINSVVQMSFLRGQVQGSQLADLAAYIADPTAANGAIASLSDTSLSFGATVVGTTSAARTVTVTNSGGSALSIASVVPSTSEFSVTANTCSSVAAGASCTFDVAFAPTAPGARSANIVVSHNAMGGSSLVAVSGTATQTAVSLSTNALDFGSLFEGQNSLPATVTLSNAGSSPLSISGVSGENAHFAIVANRCEAGSAIAPGGSCAIEISFTPRAAASLSALIVVSHNGAGGQSAVSLSGLGRELPANTRLAVEYRIAAFDYYFITSRVAEQTLLDGVAAFRRTGASFPVYTTQVAGAQGITRYYFDKVAQQGSRGSHFYTLLDAEKQALQSLNPTNAQAPRLPFDEGIDSYAVLPVVEGRGGSCAAGLQPVFRVFRGNQRFPDDPNHRFTIERATAEQFTALGWDDEGVKFCVPAP
jgi:Abnormal spindle-like microcephaly-assoc'd, ASPM-SPD-2-Hydin